VCSPPAGKTLYLRSDPILETQDTDLKMIRFGLGEIDGDQIKAAIVFQHEGQLPYPKTYLLTSTCRTWLISNITTTGLQKEIKSEFQKMQENI